MQISAPAEIFKNVFSAAQAVNDDCIIRLYDDEIRTNMVDPANVFMIMAKMPAKEFIEYDRGDIEKLGIDLSDLMDKIKSAKKDDDLYLELRDTELNLSYNRYNYSFRVLAPNTMNEGPQLPPIVYESIFTIDGKAFNNAIKAIKDVSAEIILETTENSVIFKANDNQNKANVMFSKDEDADLEAKQLVDTRCKLNSEYMELIGKSVSKCKEVQIQTRTDYPLRVSAELGNSEITMLLAPRTGDD